MPASLRRCGSAPERAVEDHPPACKLKVTAAAEPAAGLCGYSRRAATANPGYWANFDPRRPRKTVAFLVDARKAVKPFVTPDDPAAFESAPRGRGVEVTDGRSAPVI
ncbi:MAG: hypothetical protein M0020_03675 [Actinomycetota bacterium]|nr:hypothetical protein [Actinomycetota bacterium]